MKKFSDFKDELTEAVLTPEKFGKRMTPGDKFVHNKSGKIFTLVKANWRANAKSKFVHTFKGPDGKDVNHTHDAYLKNYTPVEN